MAAAPSGAPAAAGKPERSSDATLAASNASGPAAAGSFRGRPSRGYAAATRGSGRGAGLASLSEKWGAELEKLRSRNWGQLPGHLQTEILQAAQKKPNGDYAKLIKLYFEEIARTQKTSEASD